MCGMVEKVHAAGCHITGPVALLRSLSTGLPILLFLCGILHKNHKTFFFFCQQPQSIFGKLHKSDSICMTFSDSGIAPGRSVPFGE